MNHKSLPPGRRSGVSLAVIRLLVGVKRGKEVNCHGHGFHHGGYLGYVDGIFYPVDS